MFYNSIYGPFTLTYHVSKKYNKRIYLFGEYHSVKYHCKKQKGSIAFDRFVEKTLRVNRDKMIDIYTEEEFIKKKVHKTRLRSGWARDAEFGSALDRFTKRFADCLRVGKKDCKYPNVRIHYGDVRAIIGILKLKFGHWNAAEMMSLLLNPEKNKKKILQYRKKINASNFNDYLKFDKILKLTKIEKQLSKFSDKKLKEKIKKFIIKKLRETLVYKKNLDKEIKKLYKKVCENLKKGEDSIQLRKMFRGLFFYNNMLMDGYLIGRMFKRFVDEEYPYAENIMVLAGDNHCQTYRELLKYLRFKVVAKTFSTPEENCVDITKFKQPFF